MCLYFFHWIRNQWSKTQGERKQNKKKPSAKQPIFDEGQIFSTGDPLRNVAQENVEKKHKSSRENTKDCKTELKNQPHGKQVLIGFSVCLRTRNVFLRAAAPVGLFFSCYITKKTKEVGFVKFIYFNNHLGKFHAIVLGDITTLSSLAVSKV